MGSFRLLSRAWLDVLALVSTLASTKQDEAVDE
jgi:hypothetical protein